MWALSSSGQERHLKAFAGHKSRMQGNTWRAVAIVMQFLSGSQRYIRACTCLVDMYLVQSLCLLTLITSLC